MTQRSDHHHQGQAVTVTQVRSAIGNNKSQKRTLQSLGLGRIGKSKQHVLSSSIEGMIQVVSHLVRVKAT